MIDTAEKRRSAIDFGKGARGTGMPIPSGIIGVLPRVHILNLYAGIVPVTDFFFFWREKTSAADTGFENRTTPTSTWVNATDADEDTFTKANDTRDS